MKKKMIALSSLGVALLSACLIKSTAVQEKSSYKKRAEITKSTAEETSEETAEETSETPDADEGDENALYDTKPISQAYLTGDTSALDDLQCDILSRAKKVIEQCVTDGMTDYEKEPAIHDYMIKNITYDKGHLSIFGETGEHAADPYGALYDGECICSGYTTTFQMFMDMLEIPCLSIMASADGGEDHAWNMAQINGHWYYVDVTWDDPVPDKDNRPVMHTYFNTSKEVMLKRHEWDSSAYPKCDSTEDSFIAHELTEVSSPDEICAILENALENGQEDIYIVPTDTEGWNLEKNENINKQVSANYISDELADAYLKFLAGPEERFVAWKILEFDGKVIVAGYISYNK